MSKTEKVVEVAIMTKREAFAMAAMQGLLADGTMDTAKQLAQEAAHIADAMIAELENMNNVEAQC